MNNQLLILIDFSKCHCYQVNFFTVKKGSLCIFWYIMDTLVTKLHFSIFSTEGVNKKTIRYQRGQQKNNTLSKGSTKNQYAIKGVNKKSIRH